MEPAAATGSLPPPVWIDDDAALRRLAHGLVREHMVAVDTESDSMFSYREKLCLVQVSTRRRDYLIDPLAGIDLSLLAPVFADPGLVKVFHDAEFDILTLKRAYPFEFAGLFDTKVAAMALGRETLGLAGILEREFDVVLDKRLQRSDWGARPLSGAQLQYARFDTHYLPELAQRLRAELCAAGPPAVFEVASEVRRLQALVPEPRRPAEDGWTRMRGVDRLGGAGRRRLREVWDLREQIAEERDVPPFKVLANDVLMALAEADPRSQSDLDRLPPPLRRGVTRLAGAVLERLRAAAAMAPIDAVATAEGSRSSPRRGGERDAYELLRNWRKAEADRRHVDPSLVVHRGVLERLATAQPLPRTLDDLASLQLLEPWRLERYGEAILAALAAGGDRGRRRGRRRGSDSRADPGVDD